ncbi:MAG: hypothetical protein OXF93_15055 [Acidobacteria bacterium]|nr:hypothetical protein [Acidobacteriota bacterium]
MSATIAVFVGSSRPAARLAAAIAAAALRTVASFERSARSSAALRHFAGR